MIGILFSATHQKINSAVTSLKNKAMAELKKITNEELIEELKARGFWIMSDTRTPIDSFVVSVNPPKERVLFKHTPDWDKYPRGDF